MKLNLNSVSGAGLILGLVSFVAYSSGYNKGEEKATNKERTYALFQNASTAYSTLSSVRAELSTIINTNSSWTPKEVIGALDSIDEKISSSIDFHLKTSVEGRMK